jgi:hypothetical protein
MKTSLIIKNFDQYKLNFMTSSLYLVGSVVFGTFIFKAYRYFSFNQTNIKKSFFNSYSGNDNNNNDDNDNNNQNHNVKDSNNQNELNLDSNTDNVLVSNHVPVFNTESNTESNTELKKKEKSVSEYLFFSKLSL